MKNRIKKQTAPRWRVTENETVKSETFFKLKARWIARREARKTGKIQYIEKLVNSL
jgi:hypothetical protein